MAILQLFHLKTIIENKKTWRPFPVSEQNHFGEQHLPASTPVVEVGLEPDAHGVVDHLEVPFHFIKQISAN